MPEGPILVTGAAGFIGMHIARALLEQGSSVVGIDNLNAHYDPRLKLARLDALSAFDRFRLEKIDLADRAAMTRLFAEHRFPYVVHLGAQAGVRHSLAEPHAYAESNLLGFLNILEGCRHQPCRHLLYASSSSVYGANPQMPFRESDRADHPLSLYGATKKANELMAHSYAHLFGLPTTGLRFFTVYGPWGRPDMAVWLFADAIARGQPIRLFNNGQMQRDFTYIDDVTEAVVRLVTRPPEGGAMPTGADTTAAPFRVYNIGGSHPVEVSEVVALLERAIGKPAIREFAPMQPGDVPATFADVSALEHAVGFKPRTPIAEGIGRFVDWYREYQRSGS